MKQLVCKELSVGYGAKTVAENINITVNKGDYLCIVGENGSGKTTLLKTLLGLIPPVRGSVEFINSRSKKNIGYLPQQTFIQRDFPASVREIVMSGFHSCMRFRTFYNSDEKEKAANIAGRLGIDGIFDSSYRELSGGQQQRVLLARALCAAADMIILDEPVTGLDPAAAEEMYDIIDKLNKLDGMTVIMISHDLISVISNATHILHMNKYPLFASREEYSKSDIGCRYLFYAGGESR